MASHGFLAKSMMRISAFILLIVLGISFPGCGPSRIFEQDVPLEENVWKENNSLVYTLQVEDPAKAYDLFYNVRYDLDYPYYNLYVRLQVQDTAGHDLMADRHELVLLDPQTGKPLGSGIGGVYDKEFTALQKMHFTQPGTYKVRVSQYMRMAHLPGIHSFGVRVSASE